MTATPTKSSTPTSNATPPSTSRLRTEVTSVARSLHPQITEENGTNSSRFGPMLVRILLLVLITIAAYLPNFFQEPFEQLPLISRSRLAILPLHLEELLPWPPYLHWQATTPSYLPRELMFGEEWFGGSEWVHRTVGLSVHLGCVLLLWFLLREFNVPGAWLGAMIFAIHPGGVAAVARVDQHGRLWSAAFALTALLLLSKVLSITPPETEDSQGKRSQWQADWSSPGKVRRRRIRLTTFYSLALLFGWAAALCQPATGVVLAPVVVTLAIWQQRLLDRSRWKTFALIAPFILLAMSAGIGGWNTETAWAKSTFLPSINTSAWVRAFWAIGWAARWVTLPYPATGQIGFVRSPMGPNAFAFAVAVVAVIVLAALLRRRIGTGLLVAMVCFVFCIPTLFVPSTAFRSASSVSGGGDGDTYLLAIPLIAIVTSALFLLARRLSTVSAQLSMQMAGGIAMIAILALATASEAKYFANPEHVLEINFTANPTQENRARFARLLIGEAKLTKAAQVLGGIKPEDCTDSTLAVAEGDLLRVSSKPGAAIVWFQRAQTLDPKDPEIASGVAEVEVQLGRMDEAADTYKHAIELHPDNAILMNGYGLFLAKKGSIDAAIEQLRAAILAQPDFAPAHVTMGMILMDQKKYPEAGTQLLTAMKLDPQNFDATHAYGVFLLNSHKAEEAIHYLAIATAIRPSSSEAHNDLAVALTYTGRMKRAIVEFQRALSIEPHYTIASRNLQSAMRKANEQNSGF